MLCCYLTFIGFIGGAGWFVACCPLPATGDMRRHEIDLIRKISKSMKMDGCERRIFYLQTVDTQRKSFFGLHPPRERYIAKKQASGRYEQTNTLARVVVPQ